MAFSVNLSSSADYLNGYYVSTTGQKVFPVSITISNPDPVSYKINAINLVSSKAASVLLGQPDLFRTTLFGGYPNDVIPPGVTIEVSGTISGSGSGSNNPSVWFLAPLQLSYSLPPPPAEPLIGPLTPNAGYYGVSGGIEYPVFMGGFSATGSAQITSSAPALNTITQSLLMTGGGELLYGSLPLGVGEDTANDFTYEWFSYLNSWGVGKEDYIPPNDEAGRVWETSGYTEGGAWIGYTKTGNLYVLLGSDQNQPSPYVPYAGLTSSFVVTQSAWKHQAVCKSGSNIYFAYDGTVELAGTRPDTHGFSNYALLTPLLQIPLLSNPSLIEGANEGYFSSMRFSNTPLYTASYTVPTVPFSASYSGSGGGSFTSSVNIPTITSYSANTYPNPSPLQSYPEIQYDWDLSAVVSYDNQPDAVSSSAINFAVSLFPDECYVTSPYYVWSLHDNKRPPQYSDFDLQLNTYLRFDTRIYPLADFPYYQNNYTSSDTGIATVVSQSNTLFAVTGGLNTQTGSLIVGGGGAVNFTGATGSVTLTNDLGGFQPSVVIKVVDALPVSLSVYPTQISVFAGATYQLSAYLKKTNGNNENVTATVTWNSQNISLGTVDNTGLLTIDGSGIAGSSFVVSATYEGLEATLSVTLQ